MGYETEIRDAAKLAEALAFEKLDYKFQRPIFDRISQKQNRESNAQLGVMNFMKQLPVK